jgi:DNA-binding transcriptional ArsR family regulator
MTEKYLLFSLDDEKSKKLGEVISNSSCKKIVNFLADKEASASEIASELKMPLNTVEYNIDKLVSAGIIERISGFFWSTKGKKIERYKVANKLIVISPKKTNVYSKLKGIVPAILLSALATGVIAWYYKAQSGVQRVADKAAESSGGMLAAAPAQAATLQASVQAQAILSSISPWVWFALGGLIMLLILLVWNWKKL